MSDLHDLGELADEIRALRAACLINHLALMGCDVGAPRWSNWLADPEVVVAHHTDTIREDPTIAQEISSWIREFGELLSLNRLSAIAPRDEVVWRDVVDALAESGRPWAGTDRFLPTPSNQRLRLRGLLGAGSRAEILITLATQDEALNGSQIARMTGFRSQVINRELRSMYATCWVDMHADGTSKYYRLIGDPLEVRSNLPSTASIVWPHMLDALFQLIDVLEPIIAHNLSRGSLLEAFDRLDGGAGVLGGHRRLDADRPLIELVLAATRDRFATLHRGW